MKGRKLTVVIGIIILIVACAFTLFVWKKPAGQMTVNVEKAVKMNIQSSILVTGKIVPANVEEVRPLNPGRVKNTFVQVGDKVEKGQVLAQLDTTIIDSQIRQVKASITAAQTDVQTAQSNVALARENKYSSTLESDLYQNATMNSAESALLSAKAIVIQLEENLKRLEAEKEQLTLKAGWPGTVIEGSARESGYIAAGQTVIVIADLDQLKIKSFLNEVDASMVINGQGVVVTSKVLGTEKLSGAISQIGIQAVSQNNLPVVEILVDITTRKEGGYPLLKPGYSVNLNIVIAERENVTAIPQWALSQEGSSNYVYIVENNRLTKREVQLGIADEVNQEIVAGLNEGELVISNPGTDLYSGMEVKVQGGGASE